VPKNRRFLLYSKRNIQEATTTGKCKFIQSVKCFDQTSCATCPIFKQTGQSSLFPQPAVTLKTTRIETVDTQQQVACPYCLTIDKVQVFLKSTKKGVHKSQGLCPHCKNGMLMRTLLAEMTPEQYADWVAEMVGYGFWQKIPYTTWRDNLSKLGWAGAFWAKYKALKGEGTTETYEEAINRQAQEEWAENPEVE